MSIISPETISKIKEKWQHAGFQKYLKNTGWMFFGRISTLILSLFVSIYMARNLGVENFGTLNFIISFVAIAGATVFVIDSLLLKKLNSDPENTQKILGSAIVIKLINSIIAVVLTTIGSIVFANNHTTTILIIIFSTATFFQSFNVIDYYFQAHANVKMVSIISIITITISSIIKIIIISMNLGILLLVISYVIDNIIGAIGYIFIYEKYVGKILKWRIDKEIIKDLIIRSWPFTFSAFATVIYMKVDQVFLKVFLGSQAVGFYAIAVRFSEVWFFISSIICASLLPAILNSQKTNHELFLSRSKRLYSLLFYSSLVICIFIFIMAPYIIKILYKPEYMPSIILLRIYIWSIIGVFISTALQQTLLAQNKFKTILSINLVGMILSLTLNPLFINIWGIKGAAIANVISYTLPVIIILCYKNMYDQRFALVAAIFKPFK